MEALVVEASARIKSLLPVSVTSVGNSTMETTSCSSEAPIEVEVVEAAGAPPLGRPAVGQAQVPSAAATTSSTGDVEAGQRPAPPKAKPCT